MSINERKRSYPFSKEESLKKFKSSNTEPQPESEKIFFTLKKAYTTLRVANRGLDSAFLGERVVRQNEGHFSFNLEIKFLNRCYSENYFKFLAKVSSNNSEIH